MLRGLTGSEVQTVDGALCWAAGILGAAGVESPRYEAELILAHCLDTTRSGIWTLSPLRLSEEVEQRFTSLVRRRAQREPLAYLLGVKSWYDLELDVSSGALIPRPETEHLVEEALRWSSSLGDGPLRIADVGTGSGAIAIALARHLSQARVMGIDISPAALAVARRNVANYGLQDRVALVLGDLLEPVSGGFQIIVANLPYVPRERLITLAPEVRDYEPRVALDGGQGGLEVVRRFLPQVPARLATPGLLLLEIDEEQGEAVVGLVRETLPEARVSLLQDLAGLDRLVRAEIGLVTSEV